MRIRITSALALLAAIGVAALGSETVDAASGEQEALPPIVLDGGEGETVAFPLHPTARLADPSTNIAGMSFFELRVPAGTPGAPPHTHTYEDEFFYVREGTVTFMTEEDRKTIGAGGFVLLPRHGLHAFWNTGDEDAVLLVGTSAGKFGDFFDAVAMAAQKQKASTPAEVGAIVARLGAERGVLIDMSRLPEDVAALYGPPPEQQ